MDFNPKTLLQFPNVNIELGIGDNPDHLVSQGSYKCIPIASTQLLK